jgi:hypothetical protein
MATLLFYPQPQSGFFLRGGLGFALYAESNGGTVSGAGGGMLGGVGYDIRMGRNISLTAFAEALYGSVGDLTTNGGSVVETGFTQTLLHVGLGVTFH